MVLVGGGIGGLMVPWLLFDVQQLTVFTSAWLVSVYRVVFGLFS